MAGGGFKLFGIGIVAFNILAMTYSYSARKLTGWEDDTTEEYR